MWCAVHSYDDRDISAKTYRGNTTSVSLRETASPQGEAFDAHPTLVEPTHISALNDHLYEQFRIRLKSYKNFKLPVTRPGLPEAFFSGQQSRSIDVCKGGGTQCLPPGGRGTAKRWMRNGDRYRLPKHPNFPEFVQMLYRNSNRGILFPVSPFLIRPFGAPSPRGKALRSDIPTNSNGSASWAKRIGTFFIQSLPYPEPHRLQ